MATKSATRHSAGPEMPELGDPHLEALYVEDLLRRSLPAEGKRADPQGGPDQRTGFLARVLALLRRGRRKQSRDAP